MLFMAGKSSQSTSIVFYRILISFFHKYLGGLDHSSIFLGYPSETTTSDDRKSEKIPSNLKYQVDKWKIKAITV